MEEISEEVSEKLDVIPMTVKVIRKSSTYPGGAMDFDLNSAGV